MYIVRCMGSKWLALNFEGHHSIFVQNFEAIHRKMHTSDLCCVVIIISLNCVVKKLRGGGGGLISMYLMNTHHERFPTVRVLSLCDLRYLANYIRKQWRFFSQPSNNPLHDGYDFATCSPHSSALCCQVDGPPSEEDSDWWNSCKSGWKYRTN